MAIHRQKQQSDEHNAGDNTCDVNIYMYSYNMHGFNQGCQTVRDLILSSNAYTDILLLQEHWLTPANLSHLAE